MSRIEVLVDGKRVVSSEIESCPEHLPEAIIELGQLMVTMRAQRGRPLSFNEPKRYTQDDAKRDTMAILDKLKEL